MTNSNRDKMPKLPVVGVPTCRQLIGDLEYDCTQHKYLAALYKSANVLPMLIPLIGDQIEVDAILDHLDGILLTGSHSNIHPSNYENTDHEPDFKLDEARDATVLRLIKPAIENGIPLLAVCRGFQELNVAYGGSLYPKLHQQECFLEHRENKDQALDQRYGAAHSLKLTEDGHLSAMLKSESIEVNSLHEQGIKKLGENLVVEASADDGLIEAVSVSGSSNFAIGVQWHPEWKSTDNPISTILFSEFGRACQKYANNSS